jgi:hypothetical protein
MRTMGLLEELEEISGPTRSNVEIIRNRKNKNRVVNGVIERVCNRCNKWKTLSAFQQIKRVFQRRSSLALHLENL